MNISSPRKIAMDWIIYVSFIFGPIVLIWLIMWAIDKKVRVKDEDEEVCRRRGENENKVHLGKS